MYKRKGSLATDFRNQLNKLLLKIRKTEPHFVRCLKPNIGNHPNTFDSALVMNQMKNAGLRVAIKVRSTGFVNIRQVTRTESRLKIF
ncbi:hypothetical protein MHBO_001009 [Bonamia ostreae]|uniref:Myosin motor domain-containing protein n=1 Tax=Bonamia ostreae TaxID=126728 RepID=A0ABV2AHI1_9EUKA